MRAQTRWAGVVLLVALLLAGCGGGGATEPTVAPLATTDSEGAIATSVQQTIAAIAVAQTVEALNGAQPTPSPAATATATVATEATTTTAADTPSPTDAPPPTEAAPTAGTCRVVSGVNMRPGPGVVYEPPLLNLGVNTQLTPLAYQSVGFPQGPWLQAQVQGTGQVGWVSALPQYIACDFDLATLPAATFPPTPPPPPTTAPPPTVAPTATQALAAAPPDIDNDAPGGSFPTTDVTGNVIVDPNFLFRMEVFDETFGNHEGAGIRFVEFSVTGDGVNYYRKESTAGYCIFGGGEPTCNPWPTDDQGRYTWGEGGPLVQTDDFFASITVTAEREDPDFFGVWNWNFPFRVTLP